MLDLTGFQCAQLNSHRWHQGPENQMDCNRVILKSVFENEDLEKCDTSDCFDHCGCTESNRNERRKCPENKPIVSTLSTGRRNDNARRCGNCPTSCHDASLGRTNPHAMGNECENGLPVVSRLGACICGTDQRRSLVTLQKQKTMTVIRLTASRQTRASQSGVKKKLNGWIISHLSPSRGNSEREKHRNRQPRVHGRSVQATNREA